ncbi:hypothetical protein AB6A40_008363 [Gnathostoma spinigerum]|uniref:Major facilitator superfamily (MFS) profile domain-containing protein n=1 Tax=Gnathostoma spinigerum TaxID=75299 RepID=A0ABD6ETZ8_9BILA
MSDQIPITLSGISGKAIKPVKNLLGNCTQPISTLMNSMKSADANVERGPAGHYEMYGNSDLYEYDSTNYISVHTNKVLEFSEKCVCCKCRKRWQLAILANLGFMIVFGIRCNFGAAKSHMDHRFVDPWGRTHKAEFNWTRTELGIIESSFFYGYLITQIPAGFLATRFAPNKLFGLAIGMASFFNLLIPAALRSGSMTLVAVVQTLQGLFQGVSFPAMHGVWRHWAPPLERSKLATTAFTGSYAGAVLGLPISAWLVSYIDWPMPFYFYGVVGIIWSIFWFSLTFESPAFHPTITTEEKNYIETEIGPVSATHPTVSFSLLKNYQSLLYRYNLIFWSYSIIMPGAVSWASRTTKL